MIKKLRVVSILIMVFVMSFSLMACQKQEELPEKMDFETVLKNTNQEITKTVTSDMSLSFICYNSKGEPGKLTEKLSVTRSTDTEYSYAYGELKTTELTNVLNNTINGILLMMKFADADVEPLVKFINGKTYIAGRAGLYNDTLNGQVEICPADSSPTFEFADDGQNILDLESAWGAIKYSDFITFKNSFEVGFVSEADLYDMFYSAFSLPINWTDAIDTAKGQFVKVNNQNIAEYDLTYSSDNMVAFIKDSLVRYIKDLFGDDEESLDTAMSYYDKYVDLVFDIFSVSELKTIASVDESSRLVAMDSNLNVKINITDDQILNVFRQELTEEGMTEEELAEVEKQISSVKSFLETAHVFFGCSTQEEKKFEFEFRLSLHDEYLYGNADIDKTSTVFTPFDAEIPARATAILIKDEDEDYYWDFTFPEAVENELNKHNNQRN